MLRPRPLSTAGIVFGTLFFAASLTPSLLPRPFVFQAVVSAVSMAAGYALGCVAWWLWRYLEFPGPGTRTTRLFTRPLLAACAAVLAAFLWRATTWQNAVRSLTDQPEIGRLHTIGAALLAIGLFIVLLLLGRLFQRTARTLSRRLQGVLPRRVANVVGILITVVLFWNLVNQTLLRLGLEFADRVSQQVDEVVPPDTDPPTDPGRTGSAASLVGWQALGRQGRSFVTAGPTGDDLQAFFGTPTPVPIRVYVGLNAADTPGARATLALEELKRVGAFERKVLLLLTPTGTGWIDPAAIDAIEYLHRGDVASVAVQYSYLPSMLALTLEGEYGADNARALFEAVYGHWTALPRTARPRLYLHGVSLGALNSERSFHVHDILADPFDGILWSGPPFRSREWTNVTANRHPASPAWRPIFRNGSVVRVMNQDGGLDEPGTPWGPHRIAYLQYASDPITFFSPTLLYREPDWLRAPRAPDVSPALRWFPVVTLVQVAADMLISNTVPAGYGHVFAADHYVDAWIALTEPDGWSDDEVRRLRARLTAERR